MIDIKKLPEETEEQFLWRVGQMVDSGKIESWSSINDIVNKELGIDEEKWRDESSFRKRYQAAKKFYNGCFSKMETNEYQEKLDAINRELARKTIQFRDQRNAWQRQNYADARVVETLNLLEEKLSEMFVRVADCIEKLGKSVSYTCECVKLLTEEVASLREDVNRLIENNQKGASK